MTHDIAHCNAEISKDNLCLKRVSCKRYISHVILQSNPESYNVVTYLSAHNCITTASICGDVIVTSEPYSEYLPLSTSINYYK